MNPAPIDERHITTGHAIPVEHYADQPYIVRTDDGAWLCVVTTGQGREGEPGQHVVSMRSTDHGLTWAEQADVEPADGPEASYAVLLKGLNGRIYCFHNHNTDDVREVVASDPPYPGSVCRRVDSLGHYVFHTSDDHGRTWSQRRYEVPVRTMDIDRQNPYGGQLRFFWNVGRPFVHEGAAYVPLHKVGGFGAGFLTRSEGVLLRSSDLLEVDDPALARWETLPDGEIGIRAPEGGGPIAEEHSVVPLSDGSLYTIFRTVDGHPGCTYSRDGGHNWEPSRYERYADGRPLKQPRAATFCWRCTNGRYLLWFHNHGGAAVRNAADASIPYRDRNPAWLCGGWEVETPGGLEIAWSQSEIALYDDDPGVRVSYPDLVEDGDQYYIAETQKQVARVHRLDPDLVRGLWQQPTRATVATQGRVLAWSGLGRALPAEMSMPLLPQFSALDTARLDNALQNQRTGFSIDLWVRPQTLEPGAVWLDSRDGTGQGLCVRTAERGTVEIVLNDGRTENRWASDGGLLSTDEAHHLVITVDAGPRVITFVIDGRLCDGGEDRQFGWGRFSPHLRHANGLRVLHIAPDRAARVLGLRLYDRALRTSEAVSQWRAGV